jgi:hypothetical protein
MTCVGGFTFANWVKQLFVRRYVCDVEAENAAVIDGVVPPEAYEKVYKNISPITA